MFDRRWKLLIFAVLTFAAVPYVNASDDDPVAFSQRNSHGWNERIDYSLPSTNSTEKAEASKGKFRARYGPPGRYARLAQQYRRAGLLESLVSTLNQAFYIPVDIAVSMQACGRTNAFYQPQQHRIILCYELIAQSVTTNVRRAHSRKDLSFRFAARVFFVFLHETAHALIHVYDLPITGSEEDAADQLAALIMIASHTPRSYRMLLSAASQAYLNSGALSESRFADEHGLGQQRYYNIVCLLYGSDPAQQRSLVRNGYLPPARARRCPTEYHQATSAWEALLGPRLKLQRVRR